MNPPRDIPEFGNASGKRLASLDVQALQEISRDPL